jgi:ATP-dependent Clp protease ATP-binding subunit ClpB
MRLHGTKACRSNDMPQLIGPYQGHGRYDGGAQLAEVGRHKVTAAVLCDEAEKADPDVFDVLLQIMDDGRDGPRLGPRWPPA